MDGPLSSKSFRVVFFLTLMLAVLTPALPSYATLPSRYAVNAVNPEGLKAAAQKYLSVPEVELLGQVLAQEKTYPPKPGDQTKPPLMRIQNTRFIGDLINLLKPALARGEAVKVQQFFAAVNQQKLIRGSGQFYLVRGGYGGPMVIQLDLKQSAQKQYEIEVWYRLVNASMMNGQKREGPRVIHTTGIAAP